MRLILVVCLLASIVTSCHNSSSNAIPKRADTIRTLVLYSSPDGKELRMDVVRRITRDTLKYVDEDSMTRKKRWTKDTVYYLPATVNVLDSVTKQPKKDSAGHIVQRACYAIVPPAIVLIDAGKNVDSIGRIFFGVNADSTKKKK
jgi:hypothetical protein